MNDEGIEYIDENKENTSKTEKEDKKITEEFINNLPEWDLVPPYETIRRNIK